MFSLLIRYLLSRPLRTGLALSGIASASAVFLSIIAFGNGYRAALGTELDRAGIQMMLVPLGCPYDAAARVLKNNSLEVSLPSSVLEAVRNDPAVALAAPALIAALPHRDSKRTDIWVGLDESFLPLKPWWSVVSGTNGFASSNDVILGADVAALEMRRAGDKLFVPETKTELRVTGVLRRSGTSDDSAMFVPLSTAQRMFGQADRLTAIAIRLKDPALLGDARERLQKIPGAQVVTMTEMMGTFLNLIGAMRALVLALSAIAICVSALSVFNTLLASVIERTNELTVMRAIGASRRQIFALLVGEAVLLTMTGALAGLILSFAFAPLVETAVKRIVPFAPERLLLTFTVETVAWAFALAVAVGMVAAFYPAWRASRADPASAAKLV